ncbi:hypothetical protein NE237_024844 [Protea cynaroides]|uniref:NAC domain-containing protein n=1 Tax=Protea cynaroides TaxID=273540 RepID=A0A9Q0H1A5_9MAGN|nr:hypothetical protein NE237_024844 [Protea cynaroides]
MSSLLSSPLTQPVVDDVCYCFNSLPPGVIFCPQDELIVHYLMKKVLNQQLPRILIPEVKLYEHDPEYLTDEEIKQSEAPTSVVTAGNINAAIDDVSAYFNSFPPGIRFCPYDDELIVHYLMKKLLNQELPRNLISEVKLYNHTPEYLTENYPPWGDQTWYFFTLWDRRHRNGNGYWRLVRGTRRVLSEGQHVGFRKELIFYKGRFPKYEKTNWIMKELNATQISTTNRRLNDMKLDDWILCTIKKSCKSKLEVHHAKGSSEDALSSSGPSNAYN